MNDNNSNKGNNKQGYKKKFYPKKKWNNNKNKNHNEAKNQNEEILQEEELVENLELTEETAEEVEVEVTAEKADENEKEATENTEEKDAVPAKKFVKEVEDEKEDFNKPEDINEEYLKIEWPLHDNTKLSPDFHRGCRIKAEDYTVGSNVLRHSQCKLDSYNWLKDYHDTTYEGELKVAEIRFK
ncbi:MAG: hypothetical protein J6Q61_09005, partial [Bacteroidales bacterium]|nr:hypothetical protein [Bacteroidales bacterium]